MSRFILGTLCGFSTVVLIPESYWLVVRPAYVYVADASKKVKELMKYYSPEEFNKRKSKEILKQKGLGEIGEPEQPDFENQREKLRFLDDYYTNIRLYESDANQGLTRKERVLILEQTIREHYPEIFPDYEEIITKKYSS
jgi:hypothetical protein